MFKIPLFLSMLIFFPIVKTINFSNRTNLLAGRCQNFNLVAKSSDSTSFRRMDFQSLHAASTFAVFSANDCHLYMPLIFRSCTFPSRFRKNKNGNGI